MFIKKEINKAHKYPITGTPNKLTIIRFHPYNTSSG